MSYSFQKGFTYLTVLFFVFILLLSLTVASEQIATIGKREREAELIFIGGQYVNAIESYYQNSPGGVKQLPTTLDNLILDKRSINTLRHLRKLYRDPISDSNEWGLIKTPQDEILGVYSRSNERVLSVINNPRLLKSVQLGESSSVLLQSAYSDWKFFFKPDNQDRSKISDGNESQGTSKSE